MYHMGDADVLEEIGLEEVVHDIEMSEDPVLHDCSSVIQSPGDIINEMCLIAYITMLHNIFVAIVDDVMHMEKSSAQCKLTVYGVKFFKMSGWYKTNEQWLYCGIWGNVHHNITVVHLFCTIDSF